MAKIRLTLDGDTIVVDLDEENLQDLLDLAESNKKLNAHWKNTLEKDMLLLKAELALIESQKNKGQK